MRVTCLQENLARGLAIVNRAVATRTTLPILSNILIQTEESRLRLSATNLEIGINCWISARVEEEGATTVPARLLTDFVNSLPTEQLTLELDGQAQSLKVHSETYEADIKGLDPSDFPILPTVEEGLRFSIGADVLREMISQVGIAAATDESRPILTGVLTILDQDAGRITMAAADGFRLSVRHHGFDESLDGRVAVIIPARALLELSRVSGPEDELVEVSITENRNQILFRLTDVDLVSQLIDGTFPDYQRVIPADNDKQLDVNCALFADAVDRVAAISGERTRGVRLAVTDGTLVLSASSAEHGSAAEEIEVSYDGAPLEIGFNSRYLLDILRQIEGPTVRVAMKDAASPALFRDPEDGGGGAIYVLMIMRV